VMIVGEPGTGREAFARYLHSLSARAEGPFVEITASAMSAANAEQMLPRLLKDAKDGILFVQEIDDMLPEVQRVLLGALERGHDTRLVCSAAPALHKLIESGGFRRDLYQQLAIVTLHVP